jgi:hypothetical protein
MTEIIEGTVARYCKPSTLNEQGLPTGSSFQLRLPNEKYLSVYLLDYFNVTSEQEKIIEVKNEMQRKGFNFKKSGIFSTLNIEQSKEYILDLVSEKIFYQELNLPHCGIFHEADDLLISELLSQCVQNNYSAMTI